MIWKFWKWKHRKVRKMILPSGCLLEVFNMICTLRRGGIEIGLRFSPSCVILGDLGGGGGNWTSATILQMNRRHREVGGNLPQVAELRFDPRLVCTVLASKHLEAALLPWGKFSEPCLVCSALLCLTTKASWRGTRSVSLSDLRPCHQLPPPECLLCSRHFTYLGFSCLNSFAG